LSADLSDVESKLRRAVDATLEVAGVEGGHLGLELVGEGRMRTLNYAHRGVDEATDVLAFPIDEEESGLGPRELGDVFICPEHATDVVEAAVHGTLHLCGYDHETDDGEMLSLQAEVMTRLSGPSESPQAGEAGRGDHV